MGAILKFKKQLNHELHRKNESWDILGLHLIHVQKMMINEAHVQNIFEKVVVKKNWKYFVGRYLDWIIIILTYIILWKSQFLRFYVQVWSLLPIRFDWSVFSTVFSK